jgi:hypothetical protein
LRDASSQATGQLKDDPATAETIFQMLQDAQALVESDGKTSEPFRRLTISSGSSVFAVTLDGEKIYVVKRNV